MIMRFLAVVLAPLALAAGSPRQVEPVEDAAARAAWRPQGAPPAPGQLATLDGATYLVTACGADCDLAWSRHTPAGWTAPAAIAGQRSDDEVSLAAFDGALYMVHTERGAAWLSALDPRTETWSAARRLDYATFAGPPAIAAFDGALVFVGIDEDCQLWTASMAAGAAPSPARPIANHFSCSRPSLAVHAGALHVAHRAGGTGELRLAQRRAGELSWSADAPIAGPDGTALRSLEPALASTGGALHLAFRAPESDALWWARFDGCAWSTPLALRDRAAATPALAPGGAGLLLATNGGDLGLLELHAPPSPAPCAAP